MMGSLDLCLIPEDWVCAYKKNKMFHTQGNPKFDLLSSFLNLVLSHDNKFEVEFPLRRRE